MTRRQLVPVALATSLLAISGAGAFDTPASDWHLAGPFGGSATSLAIDPQKPEVLLAGGQNSLVYRSTDGGQNWSLLDFPKYHLTEVTSVLVDPQDSNHYLAGIISADGGGMFASHDQGKTWEPVKDVKGFGVRSIVSSKARPSRMISGTLRGVMLSDDSGASWKRVSDPKNLEMQGITATAIDPSNPDIMYAGTSHLPWKSIDGGATWHSIHDGMTDDSDVFSIYVNPAKPENIFASACSGIYTSGDRGDRWRKVMGLTFSQRRTHVIRKDPFADSTIYAGTTMGLFKSPNMGTTWKLLSKEQVNSIVFDPATQGNMYMAMEYEGLSRASEAGENIKMLNNGFVDRPISSATRAGDTLIALETQLGETSGLFVSRDQGASWTQMMGVKGLQSVHLKSIAALPGDGRVLVAAGSRQLYKSVDAGMTWKPLAIRIALPGGAPVASKAVPAKPVAGKTGKGTAARRTPVRKPVEVLRPLTPSEIYQVMAVKGQTGDLLLVGTDQGLLKSSDGGERWTNAGVAANAGVTGIYAAPSADGRLAVRSNAGLFLSSDFGEHWIEAAFPTSTTDVNDIALPASSSAPILVATRLGLYSSTNDGSKWKAHPGHFPASTVGSVVYGADETAFAVQYGKLYQSMDGGKSWKALPSSIPATRIRQLWIPDIASNHLYGLTSDLGILYRN